MWFIRSQSNSGSLTGLSFPFRHSKSMLRVKARSMMRIPLCKAMLRHIASER